MTHRISPFATDLLFPAARGGTRSSLPAPDERAHLRRTRRAGWFAALRTRSSLA